jgi:hypothetical protein
MIKVIATISQTEEGVAFELEQTGTDVSNIEDFLAESIAKMIQVTVNELMERMSNPSTTKHILN